MIINKYWQKGFKELNRKESENNYWIKSIELVQEIQAIASSIATNHITVATHNRLSRIDGLEITGSIDVVRSLCSLERGRGS